MSKLKRLDKKKIPTPQEFRLCPLCGEPLVYRWDDEAMNGFLYCKNNLCEIEAISLKSFDCFENVDTKTEEKTNND